MSRWLRCLIPVAALLSAPAGFAGDAGPRTAIEGEAVAESFEVYEGLQIRLSLYPTASGGVPVYSETQTAVLRNGIFVFEPDPPEALLLEALEDPLYLAWSVNGGPESEPRSALAAGSTRGAAPADAVQAGAYLYNAPRTHYYSVGDGDFYSDDGGAFFTSTGGGGSRFATLRTGALVAGVHLPDGAVVTELRVIVEDTGTADLAVDLTRRAHIADGFSDLASVASTGTPGVTTLTDPSIVNATIDNSTYAYHVRAYADWPNDNSLWIKGAVVVYTIGEVE